MVYVVQGAKERSDMMPCTPPPEPGSSQTRPADEIAQKWMAEATEKFRKAEEARLKQEQEEHERALLAESGCRASETNQG
jgi:hypothetical protein